MDEDGAFVRNAAQETGFLRPQADRTVEVVMAHNTGFVEIWHGEIHPDQPQLEMVTDTVARTATAKAYTAGKRLYGYVEGDLLYAYDMAAMGQELQPHTWARSSARDGAMNDLRSRLRDSGYRLTPQRELILAAVDKLGHATPDEVLAEVREHSSAVNASTVYRTLEVLEGLGLVRHAHLSDRAPTYHSVSDHEHFHLVCRNCRRVVSVGPGMLTSLTERLRDEQSFVVDVGHLTVFGALRRVPRGDPRGDSVTSPLLGLPGAVGGDGIDAGVAAHYGSFNGEQRALAAADGFVDLSHRDVVRISGPDRLTWLHSLTTQYFEGLAAGVWTEALILSPAGPRRARVRGRRRRRGLHGPHRARPAAALVEFLDRMRFMMRVEVADVTDEVAIAWRPRDGADAPYDLVPRDRLEAYAAAAGQPCGLWAFEALRIARGEPRLGLDTDHRTIPNEVGWIGPAVHLDKGCYRGQETVARVHTLGRPPRRLTLLHLDGTENRLPLVGTDLLLDGRTVGRVGSSARHHELGPIALALVKRNVPLDATLDAGGMPAAQEIVVDPEVGLHVRPNLR